MEELQRYHKDKATIVAIVKYILYLAIAAAVLFFSSKIIVVLFPFLLGFVLAKASRHIANGILHIQAFMLRRSKKRIHSAVKEAVASEPKAPGTFPKKKEKTRAHLYAFLFPDKKKRLMSKRSKIAVVVYVILLVVFLAALATAATVLVIQINKVITNFPQWVTQADYVGAIRSWISQFSTENGGFLTPSQIDSVSQYISDTKDTITNMLPSIVTNVLGGVISMVGNIPMILFTIIAFIMSGFYFLTDSKMVLEFLSRNIRSRTFRHRAIHLVDDLSTTLFRVLGGYLALLLITFVEALIIFLITGVNYAVFLALITAVLDFMPVLGVSATMVPLIIYFIAQGNYTGVIIILIGMAIITVVRRVIEPPILGNAMHMHPMATLFAMIVGVAVWGAIGFLMGPVVFLIVIEAAKGFSIDKKIRDVVGGILNKFSE